jgi:hypothetical protein
MAVNCGMPTPEITRVVQIDPGPTPTFTALAPADDEIARALLGDHVSGDHRNFGKRAELADHFHDHGGCGRWRRR